MKIDMRTFLGSCNPSTSRLFPFLACAIPRVASTGIKKIQSTDAPAHRNDCRGLPLCTLPTH